jgi:hypothetical protein
MLKEVPMSYGISRSTTRGGVGTLLAALSLMVTGQNAETQANAAERILQRARSAISAGRRVESVTALSGETRRIWDNGRADPVAFTLQLPDKFQTRIGKISHTLSGNLFWQNLENPPAIQDRARDATRDRAARMTILLLLRTPQFLPVQAVASPPQQFEGKQAEVVEFKGDSLKLRLFIDGKSHLPLGFEAASRATASGASDLTHRGLLQEYRIVSGVRFPFRMDETIGEFHGVTVVDALQVNPSGVDEIFTKP